MTFRLTLASGICAVLVGCEPATDQESAADLISRANVLAQHSIIVDTHIDVPYRLDKKWEDVTGATKDGNFDYPRALAGGLNAPFMSIYTPASLEVEGGSKAKAEELIDIVYHIVESAPDKFAVALSPDDIEVARSIAAGAELASSSKVTSLRLIQGLIGVSVDVEVAIAVEVGRDHADPAPSAR